MNYEIQYVCVSHRGYCRKINQDNMIYNVAYIKEVPAENPVVRSGRQLLKAPVLFGVFDGMGGGECGEIAAMLAAKTAADRYPRYKSVLDLKEVCHQANKVIFEYATAHQAWHMGTTAAMLSFYKNQISICNIGDSKIFRFFRGKLNQLSEDHLMYESYKTKSPLSQNLGLDPEQICIEPYVQSRAFLNEECYLLCTDGLTDMLSQREIAHTLSACSDVQLVAEQLLDQALKKGGKDNVTLVLCKVVEPLYLLK